MIVSEKSFLFLLYLTSPTPTAYTLAPTISLNVSIILPSEYWKNEHAQNDKAALSTDDFL